MCNLYRMSAPPENAARLFGAEMGQVGNAASEVYPGYPGVVMAGGQLRSMVWGFPLKLKGAKPGSKPKPVNNARADKLENNKKKNNNKKQTRTQNDGERHRIAQATR